MLVVATTGVLQAGSGFMYDGTLETGEIFEKSSMDIYSWIAWWRFLLGFGIGADK